ncbi:hypothetical protein RHMOL_Rhmol10G0224700 [Rhododendron molle]|uniref:Uncharacterized protein n=1 Tax=Rhododendron molle TaxID=49168 RepID=A0ACC0M558_RHOML|nr:hypothetical protein RHMOL_Rhmol10G0224700 [Rhododendron molle]
MDMLATVDPANIHYIMSSNYSNFPKGPRFLRIFDFLGDGIFNSDADSWRNQRKLARLLITHQRFHQFLVKTSQDKVEKGLVPLLDHVSKLGLVVDLQDLFQRLTFDTTCMLVTGYDPGCLSVELPDVPFSKAMDAAEEAVFSRHVVPGETQLAQLSLGFSGLFQRTRLLRPRSEKNSKQPYRKKQLTNGRYSVSKRMNFIWGDDCSEFKPERWISEGGTIKHEPSYKFLAFNAGPRTCLGKEVAFTQMKAVGRL